MQLSDRSPAPPLRRGIDAALRVWLQLPRKLRVVAPLVVMALLWWSSSREQTASGQGYGMMMVHNSMHGVAYASLAGLLLLAFHEGSMRPGGGTIASTAWSLAITIAYGVIDEVHQSFVPGRVCSVADVLADATGAAAAVAFLRVRLYADRISAVAVPLCLLAFACIVVIGTLRSW